MEKKMHAGAIKPLYQRAREFRNNATHAETILWEYLKTKPLGYKFRGQPPYSNYILDFYCHAIKDGSIHNMPEVKINDVQIRSTLKNDGLVVLIFSNETVEKKSELVVLEIENFLLKKKNEK